MEANKVMIVLIVVAISMVMLGAQYGECAVSIPLDPCILSECIEKCKELLKEKFLSASCVTNPNGKLCVCLGWYGYSSTHTKVPSNISIILYASLFKWFSWMIMIK